MAALGTLSTVANVFAMLGMADTVFRTGTQLFMSRLLDEIKLATSCQRIHRLSGYMSNVLSLTGR